MKLHNPLSKNKITTNKLKCYFIVHKLPEIKIQRFKICNNKRNKFQQKRAFILLKVYEEIVIRIDSFLSLVRIAHSMRMKISKNLVLVRKHIKKHKL
jgi:hypothetical protein